MELSYQIGYRFHENSIFIPTTHQLLAIVKS